MASLKVVKRQGVVDNIFDQLLGNISDQVWPPGGKIPSENELANSFQVSRFSVRTAIQRLVALGILEAFQGGGTYVAAHKGHQTLNPLFTELAVNPKSTGEMLELRKAIEVSICEYAALRADKDNLTKLEQLLEDMSSAAKNNQRRKYCKADVELHLELARASKNSIFLYIYEMIYETVYSHFINQTGTEGFNSLESHYDLVEAVKNKNADEAVKKMKEILNYLTHLRKGNYREKNRA
ncbi:MAG: FadR family transcriptional regulator [Treponema sp.]|jgi:DNA-binding FadR family transcriptional regulator|nr:FadR family transcriptional regulator [Treponema sp.]